MGEVREEEEDRNNIIIVHETRYNYISDLPRDMLMKILSYVNSLTIIVRCRCVCKAWYDVLLDPYFAHMHFSRARESPRRYVLLNSESSKGGEDYNSNRPEAVHFRLLDFYQGDNYDDIYLFTLNYHQFSELYRSELWGSCNGLLCFKDDLDCIKDCDETDEPLYVTNPLTMEYVILPKAPPQTPSEAIQYGFGFSAKTNQYKVIQLRTRRFCASVDKPPAFSTAMVHTLGTDVWRNIGNAPCPHGYTWYSTIPIVYFNGTLKWIAASCSSNGSVLISSFDIETEQLETITVEDLYHKIDHLSLGVFGDCLSIIYSDDSDRRYRECFIWVLRKKNHEQEYSWQGELIISKPRLETITVLENEVVLFNTCRCWNYEFLTLYNPREERFTRCVEYSVGSRTKAVAYIPSFISLKDIAAVGEDWKVFKAEPTR